MYSTLGRLFEKPDNFATLRVTVKFGFLEYRNAVETHFEPPASRWNQLDSSIGPSRTYLSRQPGGSGLIVSKSAVFDRDFHVAAGLDT